MEGPDFTNMEITVVGLGLIGGSLAKALRKLNFKKIWGVDINPEVLQQATGQGVIDAGFTCGDVPLANSDLVFLALYPSQTINFVKEYQQKFKQNALITDTAGLKQKVMAGVRQYLRPDLDFVGGHPLAGKECSGFKHASADLFVNANYILTPVQENKEESLALAERIIRSIGCNKPILMSPEEHDRIIALTSHLPHLIAAALINSNTSRNLGSLVGGSFRDATRVAAMNVSLWSELLAENKDNILHQLDIFSANLTKIKLVIENNDPESLRNLLTQAKKTRENF